MKALTQRLGIPDITAVDKNQDSIAAALEDRCISRGFTAVNDQILCADVIFLCTPVKYTLDYVNQLHGKVKPGCIITDVGSTKEQIISHVNNLHNPPCFIGGHPMAGSERTGYVSGSSNLFENAYYVLTPAKSANKESLEVMVEIINLIGAIPVVIEAHIHDRVTAGISHVPHIIASALVNMIEQIDSPDGKMRMLAAGGFRDITRIASSSPEMWQNIILSNKQHIKEILHIFIEHLEEFLMYLDKIQDVQIMNFFESAKDFRDTFVTNKKGAISPIYEITVDVADKPGIIGEIATILGRNGINIKNINVSNSREFEQGCLVISLPDNESVDKSLNLLSSARYKVFIRN